MLLVATALTVFISLLEASFGKCLDLRSSLNWTGVTCFAGKQGIGWKRGGGWGVLCTICSVKVAVLSVLLCGH